MAESETAETATITMGVRQMEPADREAVLAMRLRLWPYDDGECDPGEMTLVWDQDGTAAGFVIYSVRPRADGCDSRPVPYVEGWFVREDLRRRGIGRALIRAVEDWARGEGFTELGSDLELANRASLAAHRRLGFEPTEQVQFLRKDLRVDAMPEPVTIEPFHGSRLKLLPLFALVDDSSAAIRGYVELGEVLIARRGPRIVGHVQTIAAGAEHEIKSMAVVDAEQGQGIGAMLVRAALERAYAAGAARVVAATAAADTGNLRFFQRLGFRMDRIERDAFTAEGGYAGIETGGIPVRDRVWLSIDRD